MCIHTEISLVRKASLRKIEMKVETMRERTLYLDHLKPQCPYEQNGQIIFREIFSNKNNIFTYHFTSLQINAIIFLRIVTQVSARNI
jgi:hypothetical protein